MQMKREKGLVYSFHTSMSLVQILALVVPQQLCSKDSHKTITYWVFRRGTMLTCDPCLELKTINSFLLFPPLLFFHTLSFLLPLSLCWTLLRFYFERTSKQCMFVLQDVYSFSFFDNLMLACSPHKGCFVGSLI